MLMDLLRWIDETAQVLPTWLARLAEYLQWARIVRREMRSVRREMWRLRAAARGDGS